MKVFLIGLGGAGCRIAHQFFRSNKDHIYGVLIDTDLADLSYLKHRYRVPVGEGILGGEGTKKEIDLGFEVLQAERYRLIEKIIGVKHDVDCFFVVSALGGGTGGAAGILIEELKKNFIEPVYYVGLLPSTEDLPTITINAVKGLRDAVRHCDAFFPIDMDRMSKSTRLKGNFHSLNNQIFRYFYRIFQIGEFSGRGDIGENAVDFSDFVKSVKGLSIVGLNAQNLRDEPNADKPEAIISLTKKATLDTTLSVVLKDVQKALVVVLGDRNYIDFLGSIPARLWVEKNIGGGEVRGGDMPLSKKGGVEVLVIFSDIKRSREMAALYEKVEVLGKGQVMVEGLSEIMEKVGRAREKLSELEKELDEIYRKLKGSLNK
jgi:cell division GTPase FtsZ